MGKTYKMLNAWLRNCRSILAFMKTEIKYTKRERERNQKENAYGTVEQFLKLFLGRKRNQTILWKTVHILSLLSINYLHKSIIQMTWNAILYHWHTSPAINYGKTLVLFFLKILPLPTSFPFFFWFAPDASLRGNSKALTAPLHLMNPF